MSGKLAPSERLLDHKAFTYYNKQIIPAKHKVNRQEYYVIARMIWKKATDGLIHSTGGVLLDNFGYMAHWLTPSKKIFTQKTPNGVEVMSNFHSDGKWYNTTLFTNMFKKNVLSGWSMDKTFNRQVKKARYRKMLTGFKYKCFYTLLRSMYSGRFTIK